MKVTKKEIKQSSLIHQKIRSASFVPTEYQETQKLKYNLRFKVSKYINDRFIKLKTNCNKIIQKPRLWVQRIDFKAIKKDVSMWLIEALIEGLVINFIVWRLLGWEFDLITMLAWGCAIKQLLSIYWRFHKHGTNTTIFKKHN